MRKRTLRYAVRVPVLYTRLAHEEPVQTGIGWTEDLGERGSCLNLPTALHLGWRLGLMIFTEPEVVEVEGSVVWVRAGGQRTSYHHGVEFLHLTPAYHQSLLKALPPKKTLQRRAFYRFPLTLPVFCQDVRANTPPLEGRIGNISRSGIMIYLSQQVPPRTRVEIMFQPPRTERIRGKVRWVGHATNDSGLFRHGIEFLRGPLAPQTFLSLFSGRGI